MEELDVFIVGDGRYFSHNIDTSTDATSIKCVVTGVEHMTIECQGWVSIRINGEMRDAGRFCIDGDRWVFRPHIVGLEQVPTNTISLIKAEVFAFKQLVEKGLLVLPTTNP